MKEDISSKTVHSIDKAVELIEILAENKKPMPLNELSLITAYPKSTVHALLATLREHGIIKQNHSGKYALGLRLIDFANAVSDSLKTELNYSQILQTLSFDTGETAFIYAAEKYELILIDQYTGSSGVKIVSSNDQKLPLYATSQGKLILSELNERELNAYLKELKAVSYTPHTITDKDKLLNEIKKIRDVKYSVEDGEYKVGLRSISAGVYDTSGKLRYISGIIGLMDKVTTETFIASVKKVRNSAEKLTQNLVQLT